MIDYEVARVPSKEGKAFIREHHYSHGCHNGPMTYGLFTHTQLIGVLAIATPCSENVRRSVFGPEHKDRVTELHRLVVLDGTPTNTESYFISRALGLYLEDRPNTRAVLSFADATEGHRGVIYQATNAMYLGTTGAATFYLDPDGRLRHPRQNGHNVTLDEAKMLGWSPVRREAKHRYCFIVGPPAERRRWRKLVKMSESPYPK